MQPLPKPLPGRGPLPAPGFQRAPLAPLPEGLTAVHGTAPVNPRPNLSSDTQPNLQSSSQYLRSPFIRYSNRMRVGKLYPLRISLLATGGATAFKPQVLSGGFDPPIVIQVTAPGAQVSPNHLVVPISGGEASFSVMPIKAGRLKGAKIEFLSQGRAVSEVPLAMKAHRAYFAKLLMMVGLLLPLVINLFSNFTFVEQQPNQRSEVTYQNQEAISAWVRNKLTQNGYQANLLPRPENQQENLFDFSRKIEITQDTKAEWSTKRATALGLYYSEPTLRFLYRNFIELPQKFPFGDLIAGLALFALGFLFWLLFGSSSRKLKGAVMDIRLAGSLTAT